MTGPLTKEQHAEATELAQSILEWWGSGQANYGQKCAVKIARAYLDSLRQSPDPSKDKDALRCAPTENADPVVRNDDKGEFDEFFATGVSYIHVEMMHDGCAWMGVQTNDGRLYHLNFIAKKKLTVRCEDQGKQRSPGRETETVDCDMRLPSMPPSNLNPYTVNRAQDIGPDGGRLIPASQTPLASPNGQDKAGTSSSPPQDAHPVQREELAKICCTVVERNGGCPWDGLSKYSREVFYETADAILAHLNPALKEK